MYTLKQFQAPSCYDNGGIGRALLVNNMTTQNTTTAAASTLTFSAAMERFVDFAQSVVSDSEGPSFPDNCRTVLIVENGRKYAKVIATGIEDDSTRRSVHCFVRLSDGAILKAACWSRPAKGVRGSIFADSQRRAVTPSGAAYFVR